MKKIAVAVVAVLMTLIMNPIRVKAAEVEPIMEGYYDEIERDGSFNQYDEAENIIASIKVEDALFYVNEDTGWAQATINGTMCQGSIEDIFIYNSYLRCKFTTENGTTYNVVVKVRYTTYQEWALYIENKMNEDKIICHEGEEPKEKNQSIVQNKNNDGIVFIEITCPIEQIIPY